MKEQKPDDEKKGLMQMLGYLSGIAIILFILFGIGFSIWGIFYTM